MNSKKQQIIDAFTPVVNAIQSINNEIEKTNSVLDIQSDFIASIYKLYDVAVKTAENLVDDNWDYLSWFIFENDCGRKKLECEYKGKKYAITSIEDLAEFITIENYKKN